jgi:hypothetical protein
MLDRVVVEELELQNAFGIRLLEEKRCIPARFVAARLMIRDLWEGNSS